MALIGLGCGKRLDAWAGEAIPSWETPLLREWLHSGGMEIHLIRGRLEGASRSLLGSFSRKVVSGGRTEQMSVRGAGPSMSVAYESRSPGHHYVFQMDFPRSVRIRGVVLGEGGRWEVQWVQEGRRPMEVKLLDGSQETAWKASSLWHLAFEEPTIVRKYIIPLFRCFLPEADLLGQTEEVQRQMLSMARTLRPQAETQRWEALVAQLADPQYTRREAADRALRQAGPAVIPFLRNLEFPMLDAEQRFRIRRILQDFQKNESMDTISGIAHWLLYDPEIWWILLDRPELETRRIALQRLTSLLEEPIEFDPEASAEIRAAQRQRLEPKVRFRLSTAPGKE